MFELFGDSGLVRFWICIIAIAAVWEVVAFVMLSDIVNKLRDNDNAEQVEKLRKKLPFRFVMVGIPMAILGISLIIILVRFMSK